MSKYQNPEVFIVNNMDVFYRRYCVNSTYDKWKEWITKDDINSLFNLIYAEFIEKVKRGKFEVKARIKTFLYKILCNKIIDEVSKNPAYKSETDLKKTLKPLFNYFFQKRYGCTENELSTTFEKVFKRLRQVIQGNEFEVKDNMNCLDYIFKEGEKIIPTKKKQTVIVGYEAAKQKVLTKFYTSISTLHKTINKQYSSDNISLTNNQFHAIPDVDTNRQSTPLSEKQEELLKFIRKEIGEKRYQLLLLTKGMNKSYNQSFEELEEGYASFAALKKDGPRALAKAKKVYEKYLHSKKKEQVIGSLT